MTIYRCWEKANVHLQAGSADGYVEWTTFHAVPGYLHIHSRYGDDPEQLQDPLKVNSFTGVV